MASNPFASLTEPSTAFAPPEQDKAPANPFEGLAAYSTAPDKVPRGTKIPGSVAGTEPIRWITIGGHPVPIKSPSGADHMLPVPGNTNVLEDPGTKEHYFKTPGPNGEFKSIWPSQRKVAKDGKIISHVKGVGDHEWGDDPKVAERAQKKQEAADKKEQKDATTAAAGDTKEVLQQAAIPVTVAKETLAHQDKLFSAQVTKAQTNKKLSAGVVNSTQDKANEVYSALKTHVETNHDPAAGKYQGNDEDFVPRFKKLKLPEGTSEDQYKSKEVELRKQYRDAQATANAAKRVDDENKRFVATAYFHKQAWLDQSKPLREGLKQTTVGLKSFKDQKLLTEGTASRLQANEEQVRTSWPLKTNTGRNADGSARPPQITPPPDFNHYNPEAPQPTPVQTQAAGRDVIAEHMDISGLPPMPRVGIQPRTLGSSFLPLNGPKLATPTKDGEVPDLTGEPEDSLKESRASVLKGLQNANRGIAYNVPDKPITWDKDTLQHDGQPVGKIQRDEFGAPALYIDHGHDGQKVSPSLNSGHYYDGIPELSSPSPAHLDEFKASGVTKPEDVQKAWGQRRWSTSDLNDLVDQWTSSNDDERQDLIAQTNPSQANVAKGQRRLNTRELYKEGMISAQDARMLDHAFYGRKPGVEDPGQSFEQFKQSEHPDAKALASFAHDNTTLNPIAAGASQDAYGRALTSWSADYLKRNATSPDFDRKEFIAARDKLLQPLGQRATAWVDKTTQGLAGIAVALPAQLANVPLGIAKTGSELALEKAGLNTQGFKDTLEQFAANQRVALPYLTKEPAQTYIHPHDANERELIREGSQGFGNSFMSFMGDHLNYEVLKAAVTNLFSPVNPSEANAATVWEGKNGSKVKAATKELFDSIDSESMTPAKLKELSVKLRDASIELHGIKNFDATNTTGYDYNGRYDVSDPRSPLAQALAGYAETADPSYKEMFKQALSTSEGGDALAQKMSEYLQAHGHIAGTPVGAAMSWLNRLSGGALHYDNPDAWRTLSESAGNTVQPLQVMAIQEALGATSALPGILKGAAAPIVKSTGRALLASGELANGASNVAKAMQKISTIPLDTAAQSAGGTFAKQLGTSAMHGAGFMALQQPGMGIGQSIGDVTQAGAEGAGIGMVAGAFNAASKALDIRRTNAAQNQAHADFVSHWNESFPQNPITIADSRQASHYMGPEEAPRLQQIRTLADQFQAIKDKVSARTATREEFEQLKPLRLQLDNLFVAQQHAMDGAVAATQEINGITDPNLKGWANAALKQLSGNPLTPVEEAAMTSAVTENGLPLSTPNGDGTHTITDAGLATMEQVAPATRRAYFPSDETSQFTTPNEQPTSAQPPTAETAPTPGDPSQEVNQSLPGAIGETTGEDIRPAVEKQNGQLLQSEPTGGDETGVSVGTSDPANLSAPEQNASMGVEGVRQPMGEEGIRGVEAPPETVNPAPSSPEPATQADPARAETVTEPAKATTPEEVKASTKAVKLPINQHIGKAVAAVATALGEKIVDTGIPSGFTSFGKHINWGTQIYDKVVPGGPVGQWMDGLAKANPQVHEYLQHTHTAPWLHRMWFGHDWLMNWHKIVDQFGAGALPTYFKELFKDNLTKQGLPLPGAQWIWEKGLVDRTEGNADWMSMNIGEEMSAGIAITGTAMLFKKLVKGEQIHDGWALTGMLVKAGTGVVQHNPILILTSAADAAIIAAANTKSIAKAFRLRAERRAALDKAIEPGEKKLQGFKPQTTTPNELGTPSAKTTPRLETEIIGEPKEIQTPAGAVGPEAIRDEVGVAEAVRPQPDYRGIARDQIAEQLKDSPALRDLVEVHEEVPEDMQDAGGMALTRENGIRVALPQLEEQLQGMTPEEARTHVGKVLDEEVRHVAHVQAARMLYDQKKAAGETGKLGFGQWMQEHYGKMWGEFSPEQQKYVRDAYGKTLDAQPDANKAMEALRIISQRRATGDQSETSMLWQKLPQSVLEHLKAVFDYLKNLSKQKLTPALEQELSGIEQVLKEHNYGQKEKALRVEIPEGATQYKKGSIKAAIDELPEKVKVGFQAHGTTSLEAVESIITEGPKASSDGAFHTGPLDPVGISGLNTKTSSNFLIVSKKGSDIKSKEDIGVVVMNVVDSTDPRSVTAFENAKARLTQLGVSLVDADGFKKWVVSHVDKSVDEAAHEAATSPHNDLPEPTQAQAEAENFKSGHVKLAGLDITVTHPQGGTRFTGTEHERQMQDHYGRIKGSLSVDGDHLDVFVKPGTPEDFKGNVFVVHQMDPKTGKLDEFKTMLGYASKEEAQAAYQANYSKGWKGMGDVVEMTLPEFKAEMQRMTEVQKHPAMVELRKSNEELPAAAQKLWTPEVYAKAADFYKTGEVKALDGLTVIQKRRITAAGVKSSPEALAREAAAEKAMRQKEAEDVKHMRATTEKFLQSAPLRVRRTQAALTEDALKQASWKDWYSEHQETLKEFFGPDDAMFQKILAVTSQAASVKANVGLALKAYTQIKRGESLSGFLPAVVKNLEALRDGTEAQGQKIQAYTAANEGNKGSVVVDRHISRMFFGVDTPSAAQFAKATKVLTKIASDIGWEPRQVQAALWAASIVKSGKTPESYANYLRQLHSKGTLAERLGEFARGSGEGEAATGDRVTSAGAGQEADRPVTEKFLQSAPVKPEQDAAYTDAVKRGDTETAQKLVDEAAKAAFPKSSVIEPMQSSKQKLADMPLLRVYHGTNAEITKFESGRKTTDDYGWLGPVDTHRHAIFFAENRDFAQTFAETRKGKNIVSAYLNIENPFLFSDVPDLLDVTRTAMDNGEESANGDWQMLTYLRSLRDHWEAFDDKNGEEFAQWLKAKGYDGVQFQEEGHGLPDTPTQDVWAALDPNQIKSADPITKDANGEVIPLSQRFNPQSDDIRYSAPIKRTPEEIAEMMKGLPAEERAKIALDNNLTAPKNAVTEEMQSRLNMPATQKIAALKETEVDALARRKLATNPDAPRAILNEFNQSGKAMSAADVRVLGKESGRIYSRLKEIEDLRGKASPEERAAMAAESRELRPYLDELYQAISHTGTLSSDALRSRKYLEELNHSEAGIKQALRNAFGGRDLTPEEEATVAKEAEEISKAYIAVERQKAIEDAPKVSAALQRAVTDASQPITAPTQRTVSGAALKQIKSRAAKARELLAKSAMEPAQSAPLKSAPIKLSAEKLAAYADIAAEHLLEGRNISDELVKEYPDSRPHLSEIITEAKKVHAGILAEAAKAEQAKAAKAAAKLDPKNIMAAAKAGEYGDEISPQWMHELAMAHIVDAHKDGGTPTETDIIKRMVKDVKTLFPDAGEREVREALVEYGKINQPNPEQMASELRQLKRISRLVLSKEDATGGKAPPKSQIRDKQSPEERQMRRELSRIMDEHNVERQDPERALASRRDRLKSSLNNQIEDLQRIIDSKAKPERKLSPVVDDNEIKQLKARKQALVDQVNAMDSVKTATEAQRVETAIKAAKASQMEWERKLRDQEILAKKTKTPEANAAVIEARKQRDAAREAYADMVDAKDMHLPGALFKEAERKLEAAKKREAEIRDKIINGDTSSPEKKPAFTTPELEAQKGVNAELNKQLAKMRSEVEKAQRVADKARQANLPGDLFKRAETQLKAAQKREAELQDKLAKGDLAVKKITGQFKTPELEQAQARVKALNDQMAKLRREAPRTAEQEAKAREVYLRQNDARIAEIERKIREQDFAPKAKKEFPHDDLTTKSKVMLGKANERLQSAIKAKELADRSRFRRGMDATVHVLREIKLANLVTSGEKLGGAALENVLTRPLSQLAAATTQIPRMVGVTFLNDIRRKATYEGSLNQNAELRALRRMGSAEGLKAVWDKVRHGKSDLDWMHKDPHFTEEMTSYFGRVHGMIKEPVRQGIYSRSMKIRSDIAAKMGIDFKTDEIAANEASARAYEDANREIFMGDNILTSGVRKMLNHWRNDKKNPGASKLMADAFEVLLPIINVPTNLAGRGMLLNPLVGFTKAAWGIMKAFNNGELKNGAETLSEKDAEIIMRAYKYGMLGTAAALYAWNNPQHFGGIYTGISHPGGNDDKTLKAGDIHIPGTSITINHHLAHGPLGTHLNVVADARREYDRILEKTGKKTDAALDAMAFLTMAPVRQLPYVQAILRAADPLKSLGQNAGSLVRDSLYGTAFTNYYDTRNGKPVKRSPRDFKEELMLGIPGLRQQVPESKSQEKADAAATTTASPFSGLPRPSRRPQTHRRPHR